MIGKEHLNLLSYRVDVINISNRGVIQVTKYNWRKLWKINIKESKIP